MFNNIGTYDAKQQNSRCLEVWSKAVLSVWYILSIETKTQEKKEMKVE